LEIARHAKEPVLAAESIDLHKLAAVRVEAISPLGAEVPTTATAQNGPEVESPSAEQAKPTPLEPVPNPPAAEELPQQQTNAPAIAENKEPELQKPVAPPAPPAPANTEETKQRELPKTAGELPLIALIGALCMGAGVGIKVFSPR
jgi:hypothetical protein